MSEISLKINGKYYDARRGETVLEVCERADIHIPTLCHREDLPNVGACRLCIVEVDDGQIKTACTMEVEDGMEIKTDTDRLKDHRRTIIDLIFAEENHYCMYCEQEGDCELEDVFKELDLDSTAFPLSYMREEVDGSDEHIALDRNRCIRCGRCIRMCREVVANDTLEFGERGRETRLIADMDVPIGESSCISCGACVQACPTGSLYGKHSAFRGNEEDLQSVDSTCTECSIGCGIRVFTRSGSLARIEGTEVGDESGGQLCSRGRFEVLTDVRRRVRNPLRKENGRPEPIGLDEVLYEVSNFLKSAGSFNAISSNRVCTETVEKFRELVDHYGGSFRIQGSEKMGIEGEILNELNESVPEIDEEILFANSIEEVLDSDTVAVFDTSIVESHPVLSSYVRRASKKGMKLISVDSNEDKLENYSDVSISLGSPKSQLTGIVLEALEKNLDSISQVSGNHLEDMNISPGDILNMTSYLKEGKNTLIVGPKTKDEHTLVNIYALAALTGSRIISLDNISNQALKEFEMDPLRENADVSYIFASDDNGERLDEMIEVARTSDFVIVQASRHSRLTEKADIVLPSLTWDERFGSFVDVNGEKKKVKRSVSARVQIDSDRQLFEDLMEGEVDEQ
ncbi:MAG: 2Fe-2S iron-sulfur cluster-binding protein [Candidatus Hadarchaeia archaeon]